MNVVQLVAAKPVGGGVAVGTEQANVGAGQGCIGSAHATLQRAQAWQLSLKGPGDAEEKDCDH